MARAQLLQGHLPSGLVPQEFGQAVPSHKAWTAMVRFDAARCTVDDSMTLAPASAGSGIIFQRTDLPDEPKFKVIPSNAEENNRGTNLRCGDHVVHRI